MVRTTRTTACGPKSSSAHRCSRDGTSERLSSVLLRSRATLLSIILVVSSLTLTAFVATSAPAGASGPTWSQVTSPSVGTGNNSLVAVSCPTSNYCLAVGSSGGAYGPLAEVMNNGVWTVLSTPYPYTTSFNDVSCTSAGNCYVVGNDGANDIVIAKLTGSTWSSQSVTQPGGVASAVRSLVPIPATASR